jgi:hypothetical protein
MPVQYNTGSIDLYKRSHLRVAPFVILSDTTARGASQRARKSRSEPNSAVMANGAKRSVTISVYLVPSLVVPENVSL